MCCAQVFTLCHGDRSDILVTAGCCNLPLPASTLTGVPKQKMDESSEMTGQCVCVNETAACTYVGSNVCKLDVYGLVHPTPKKVIY